jgi:TM2 domain-containing membrane protein YozV
MNCAYHPINLANARCGSCMRGLCPACDHRIKGYPYCQDCIVAGIEMLRRGPRQDRQARRGEKSPGLAALLGFVPGLGAAYNGQNIKALVHFAVIVGLWQVADLLHAPLFGIGGAVFYFYSIYDAHRSAQRQRQGEDLRREDDRLKQFLRENTHIWGGVLVGVGLLSVVSIFISSWYLARLWPLLLIVAGFYLLRQYRRARHEPTIHYRTPPPSVIPMHYEGSAGSYARTESGRYDQ